MQLKKAEINSFIINLLFLLQLKIVGYVSLLALIYPFNLNPAMCDRISSTQKLTKVLQSTAVTNQHPDRSSLAT